MLTTCEGGFMLKLFISMVLVVTTSKAVETLSCSVPSESSKKVNITLKQQSDEKSDYLTLQITDTVSSSTYLTQADKGEITKSFSTKNFSYFLLSDKSQNNNGVVTNAAYLSIENQHGTVAGFISAKGNIYPLVCSQEH